MDRIGAQAAWSGSWGAWGCRGSGAPPLPCQDQGVGVLKAADPATRMGVEDGAEGL